MWPDGGPPSGIFIMSRIHVLIIEPVEDNNEQLKAYNIQLLWGAVRETCIFIVAQMYLDSKLLTQNNGNIGDCVGSKLKRCEEGEEGWGWEGGVTRVLWPFIRLY